MGVREPLDLSKLNRGWRIFVPQRCALEYCFKESQVQLNSKLKNKGFSTRFYSQDDNIGLSVLRDKGRIVKRLMQEEKIQAWLGLYYWPEDGKTYLNTYFGWRKDLSDKIKPAFRSVISERGFKEDFSEKGAQQRMIEFSKDKPPASVLGKSNDLSRQSKFLSIWLDEEAKILADLLAKLEKSYWKR